MNKYFLCYLFFFTVSWRLTAQISPAENDTLNYRLIGFSFPKVKKEKKYTVEIAEGAYAADSVFAKNVLKPTNSDDNRVIALVPSFGKSYTWRVRYDGTGGYSAFHHFMVASD